MGVTPRPYVAVDPGGSRAGSHILPQYRITRIMLKGECNDINGLADFALYASAKTPYVVCRIMHRPPSDSPSAARIAGRSDGSRAHARAGKKLARPLTSFCWLLLLSVCMCVVIIHCACAALVGFAYVVNPYSGLCVIRHRL